MVLASDVARKDIPVGLGFWGFPLNLGIFLFSFLALILTLLNGFV